MARGAIDPPSDMHIAGVDLRDVAACSCQRLRKAARRATQIYETHMRSTGLTIGQFGVLGFLYGAHCARGPGLAMGVLADLIGMDPTTLKRVVTPLVAHKLAASLVDPSDRRVRLLAITAKGTARLTLAVPLWREAENRLRALLGEDVKADLDRSVDTALTRLRPSL